MTRYAAFMTDSDLQPDPDRHPEFFRNVLMKRFFAWIMDVVLISIVTAVIVPFTAFTALFFLPILFLIVGFFYRWITLSGRGATFGMRLMNIEFLDARGQRLDAGGALVHTLGYSLSMASILPQLISLGLMFMTARGQSLYDLLLGVVAINSPSR